MPLLAIRLEPGLALTREAVAAALLAGEPRIVVALHLAPDSVVINPHMLQPGQEAAVARCCRAVLLGAK